VSEAETVKVVESVWTLLTDDMQLPVTDAATDLIEEGLLDSLVFVDLIARLEEAFSFEIDLADPEIDAFRSVNDIAAYVQKHSPAKAQIVQETANDGTRSSSAAGG